MTQLHRRSTATRGGAIAAVVATTLASVTLAVIPATSAAADDKTKVTVVATGGTLAGKATGRDTYTQYRAGTYPMSDLLAQIQPEVSAFADVDVVQFGNAGSGGYTMAQYRELTLAVEDALETSDSVVVTTGTDTMEEFAYWLDLTVQSKKPVVITGAMRPWAAGDTAADRGVLGTDGPANLLQSIRLAASEETYCFGTVLSLNDEIHAAREVTKGNSTRNDTFVSRTAGQLGWVDGAEVTITRAPARIMDCRSNDWFTPFDMDKISASDLPRVEIFYNYQAAGGEAISAFADAGAKGIVTAGTGAGGISSAAGAARTAASRNGVWFVSTTRTGSGSVSGGSGNIIAGGDLIPQKARLLLMLSRAYTDDVAEARSWFQTIGSASFGAASLADEVDAGPTPEPTTEPTSEPTDGATGEPTTEPTDGATSEPTAGPTTSDSPTPGESDEPGTEPTDGETPGDAESEAPAGFLGAGGNSGSGGLLGETGATTGAFAFLAMLLMAAGAGLFLRRKRQRELSPQL
ncbi:MAG: asparaginase domain-containing protein [Mycetocola sp.]